MNTPLNYPKLPLPDGEETVAFRAVDNILRSDDTLATLLGNGRYIAWSGDVEDLWEPTVDSCPFLRISPGGLGSTWETENQHRMPMSISIEAAVVGSNFDQIGNFWAAIRRALFPQGDVTARDAVRAKIQAAGISRGILTAPSYGIRADDSASGVRITRADGSLELILLINTP